MRQPPHQAGPSPTSSQRLARERIRCQWIRRSSRATRSWRGGNRAVPPPPSPCRECECPPHRRVLSSGMAFEHAELISFFYYDFIWARLSFPLLVLGRIETPGSHSSHPPLQPPESAAFGRDPASLGCIVASAGLELPQQLNLKWRGWNLHAPCSSQTTRHDQHLIHAL
jgi:hypothetical protein